MRIFNPTTSSGGAGGETGATGATGSVGPAGSVNYLGLWDGGTIYNIGSVVSFDGSLWYCIRYAPSGYGPFGGYIDDYWTLFVERGATGEVGSTGATGPQGIQGPGGGGGAGGLMFYLNQNTSPDSPIVGLPTTSSVVTGFAVKELGRIADTVQTTVTTQNLPTEYFNLVAGFVSDVQDPNITTIPPGLWDLNFWASSTANTNNQTVVQVKAYVYNGATLGEPFATSDELYIYDPTVVAQYTANLVVGSGVTMTASDRIYIEIWAKGSSNNYTLTLKFGAGTPTHLHTTIPSVSGTGIVKVENGLFKTPASLIVDADISSSANIALSKIDISTLLSSMNMSATSVDTYNRGDTSSTAQSLSTGNVVHMSLFTPLVDITANYITVVTGTQPSSGSLQLGLYTFNESNNKFTKVAETSTHNFNSAAAGAIKLPLASAYSLSSGTRYAVAVAVSSVTSLTLAALPAATILSIYALSPLIAAGFTSQNSLLSEFTYSQISNVVNYRAFARVSIT